MIRKTLPLVMIVSVVLSQSHPVVSTSNVVVDRFYEIILGDENPTVADYNTLFQHSEWESVAVADFYSMDIQDDSLEYVMHSHAEENEDESLMLKKLRDNKFRFLPPEYKNSEWMVTVNRTPDAELEKPLIVDELNIVFENTRGEQFLFVFLVSRRERAGLIGETEIVKILDYQRQPLLSTLFSDE